MRVGVFGCGYVGLVTAACLSEVGNQVVAVDVDEQRVARLREGEVPIYEPGLTELVREGLESKRLQFTADAAECITRSDILFIAVGTPMDHDGSADLQAVLAVAAEIGRHMDHPLLVAIKSTVPVGTCYKVQDTIKRGQTRQIPFQLASNPEFLKEGAAVKDFQRPDRIIIGIDTPQAEQTLRTLYGPYNRNRDKVLTMDIPSAELTKYASNAMLATRISFMNELAGLAEAVGADIEHVRIGMGGDPRIGHAFLYAGAGFGGSCFPKDLRALGHIAHQHDCQMPVLEAVQTVNAAQKRRAFETLHAHFGGELAGRTIALWGLAFKPNTDDVREAPSRVLMESLWQAGASVRAHDPEAMPRIREHYPEQDGLTLLEDPYEAIDGADALVVITEWKPFWSPDFERIARTLREPVLVDGRNIYDPQATARAGLIHYGIGRAAASGHAARAGMR